MPKKDEGKKKMRRMETDPLRNVVTEHHRTKRISRAHTKYIFKRRIFDFARVVPAFAGQRR
jgi:hypothetical protein